MRSREGSALSFFYVETSGEVEEKLPLKADIISRLLSNQT